MKKLFLYTALVFSAILTSCKKDAISSFVIQNHNDNRMMDSLHVMMSRMEVMPKTNDPEIDFPKMMIMHHTGAINMGKVQLQNGKIDSLKLFSQKMIADQQKEIQELSTVLSTESVNNVVSAFTMEQMSHMKKMDQIADIQLITGDIDNDFATLMILHHNSAIENSESYLMYGTNPQLKAIALKMIDAQKNEIKELSDLLIKNGKR